jgi:hypothetical protein
MSATNQTSSAPSNPELPYPRTKEEDQLAVATATPGPGPQSGPSAPRPRLVFNTSRMTNCRLRPSKIRMGPQQW